MADHEAIRETMVAMAEGLDALGFVQPLEDVEGCGDLGRAVSNPRGRPQLMLIEKYVKALAYNLAAAQQRNPSSERLHQAKGILHEAWQNLQNAIQED